jgi:hypothetical protein
VETEADIAMKLRFSIRDLLWLTALCAVLVAWWIDRSRLAEQLAIPRFPSIDGPFGGIELSGDLAPVTHQQQKPSAAK